MVVMVMMVVLLTLMPRLDFLNNLLYILPLLGEAKPLSYQLTPPRDLSSI
jgi:hypothetical protein